MGYLDNAGLAYFWGKVKTALAGKQNAIAAGDGLTKEGDTLSVATPVRGIVTQAEFDALTEEQRSKGLYVISGGGGESAGEVYSTEETRIGTWIDGKPLYRIVFSATTPSGLEPVPVLNLDDHGIDKVIKIEGFLNSKGGSTQFICSSGFIPASEYTWIFRATVNSSKQIILQVTTNDLMESPATLMIEYTKTADEGGTA